MLNIWTLFNNLSLWLYNDIWIPVQNLLHPLALFLILLIHKYCFIINRQYTILKNFSVEHTTSISSVLDHKALI